VTVVFADAEPNGLADVVGELVRQNLERHPDRMLHLTPTVATIAVPDAEVGLTIAIAPPDVTIANGRAPGAHLRIRARSDALLRLTAAPLRFGLPDPFRAGGRAVLADLLAGRARIGGLVRHPVRTARLARLLSVAEP
jgi:hypothetical protein